MKEKKKRILDEILSWVIIVVSAAVVAFLINKFLIYKTTVVSGSMENTVMTGDTVLGFRTSYWFSAPKRGDIVVFPAPDGNIDPVTMKTATYLKRVIGLPGEIIEIRDGYVFIDGVVLHEDYLAEEMDGSFGPVEVPEGSYFMMGDNRNWSADARSWDNKFVKKEDIIARIALRYEPSFTWYDRVGYE